LRAIRKAFEVEGIRTIRSDHHGNDWQDPADARPGEEVGAGDFAGDGAVAQHGAKWLREPVEGSPKYERERRATKLTPYHEVLKLALAADAHRVKRERRTGRALYAETTDRAMSRGCTSTPA
jgi:hypothetical protein